MRNAADQVPSDHELLEGVSRRDSDALRLIYRRYGSRVLSLVRRIVIDSYAAEEILQDVFFRLWNRHAMYAVERGPLDSWLFGIARNLALESKRNTLRAALSHAADATVRSAFPTYTGQVRQEQRCDLIHALEALPAAQRETIEKVYFEGCTHGEIARQFHQPVGTVKTRLRLGLNKMRQTVRGNPS